MVDDGAVKSMLLIARGQKIKKKGTDTGEKLASQNDLQTFK
jgi:hypothetical protein